MLRARLVQHIHLLVSALVTYPLFGCVPRDRFVEYHTQYDSLIPFPVILPVILLMNGSVLLVWFHPSVIPLASAWAGAALQVFIALSTVLLQVPAHQRLQRHGFSPQVHHKLILFKLAPHCGHFCACVAFALDCGPRCRSCRNFFLSVAPFPNPKRARRVETANGASGFKSQGQFIAALHVSHNLNISFEQLKMYITKKNDSLGAAIRNLRLDLDSKKVTSNVMLAERQARRDVQESNEIAESSGK